MLVDSSVVVVGVVTETAVVVTWVVVNSGTKQKEGIGIRTVWNTVFLLLSAYLLHSPIHVAPRLQMKHQ